MFLIRFLKFNCAAIRTACSSHWKVVFAKTFFRFANRTDDFRTQIFFTANPVVDFFCEWIVKEPVHREIPARRISFGIGKNDFLRAAAILIIRLGAESGDLKLVSALDHDDDAKFFADGNDLF